MKLKKELFILIGLAGSHGYGLNRPESDYDYRGVFIASKRYYLGFDQIEQKDSDWDELGIFSFLDGNYSYEQVMKMATDLMTEIQKVDEESILPEKPDLEKVNELCIKLVEMQGWDD
ncbi:hypothetical protein FIS3754_13990 [Fischerella sp. NIES-3754]|nr:hypothetical protein FIS3754_13990 [Fischerella sp. NIES-3754]BCX07765.1 MAG: hypothetical protein KatS3mg066_1624 [Fischerella sp.]